MPVVNNCPTFLSSLEILILRGFLLIMWDFRLLRRRVLESPKCVNDFAAHSEAPFLRIRSTLFAHFQFRAQLVQHDAEQR